MAPDLDIQETLYQDAGKTVPYTSSGVNWYAVGKTGPSLGGNGVVNPDASGVIEIPQGTLSPDDYLVIYEDSSGDLLGVQSYTVA